MQPAEGRREVGDGVSEADGRNRRSVQTHEEGSWVTDVKRTAHSRVARQIMGSKEEKDDE